MSGHSKWSTIKHQKGAEDRKRGNVFTKLTRVITLSAKRGGGDPEANFKLRLAIEKAKEANMPKDKINKAIEMGLGKTVGSEVQECFYEGYGPSGIAVMMEIVTDNKNRIFSEIKTFFEKNGGSLGSHGSVSYLFENCGLIRIDLESKPADETMLKIIDLGVLDVDEVKNGVEIFVEPSKVEETRKKLEKEGFKILSAELFWRPKTTILIEDPIKIEKAIDFLERLEELDDVQAVYSNVDVIGK
jgi:YebC/PmpR family DNA-binding regulatory protein